MWAALYGHEAVVQVLLQQGADPLATDEVSEYRTCFIIVLILIILCRLLAARTVKRLWTWLSTTFGKSFPRTSV